MTTEEFTILKAMQEKINSLTIVSQNGGDSKQKGANIPFLSSLDEWLEMKRKSDIKINTANKYESLTNNHIRPFFTSTPVKMLADITRQDMQEFIIVLKEKGLSASTIVEIFSSILNPFFKDTVEDGNMEKTPCRRLHLPKVNRTKGRPAISPKAINKFLLSIPKDDPWYIAILLLALTGLRRGELLGIAWEDVDLEKRIIYIHQTNVNTRGEKTQIKEQTKTDKGRRTIPLSQCLVDALRYHKKHVQRNKSEWVIAQRRAKRNGIVNPCNFSRWLRDQKKKAGITEPISSHSFRHFLITMLVNMGIPQRDIMDIAGHGDRRMTDLYIDEHLRRQANVETAEKASDYIRNIAGVQF